MHGFDYLLIGACNNYRQVIPAVNNSFVLKFELFCIETVCKLLKNVKKVECYIRAKYI